MNITSEYHNEKLRIASIWCYSVILLVGIIGNTTIIYIYGYVSQQRFNNFQRLLLALAICGLLKTITGPPLFIYWNARGYYDWDYGSAGCQFFPGVWQYFTNITLGFLIIMLLDSSRVRISAGKGQFSWTEITRGIFVVILLSVFRFVPLMHHFELNKSGKCVLNRSIEYNIASISLNMLTDGIYFIFYVVSYISVKIHFFGRHRKIKRQNAIGSLSHGPDLEISVESRGNHRIVNALATLFVLTVFPFDIVQLLISFSIVFKKDAHVNLEDN